MPRPISHSAMEIAASASLPESQAPLSGFRTDAEGTLNGLRVAVARLLQAGPAPLPRATDLQRLLGVPASLGWQVFRLAEESNPLAAAGFIPRPGPMQRVLRLARKQGFRPEAVSEVEDRYAEFMRVVGHHAEDRETFDAMVAALRGEEVEQIDVKDRKAAFRVNSRLWGFMAKTCYRCLIGYRDLRSHRVDVVSLVGCAALRQLRTVPSLVLRQHTVFYNSGATRPDEQGRVSPFVLLEDFCTQPPPSLRSVQSNQIFQERLQLESIGRNSWTDCFAYDVNRNVRNTEFNPSAMAASWSNAAMVNIPCETFVVDVLLPRVWVKRPIEATMTVHGSPTRLNTVLMEPDSFVIPMKESVAYLGNDLEALHSTDVPRCPEMVRELLRRMGWAETTAADEAGGGAGKDRGVFDIFRCRVKYPILDTAVALSVETNVGTLGDQERPS